MADQLEGARTLPVKFVDDDAGGTSVAEALAARAYVWNGTAFVKVSATNPLPVASTSDTATITAPASATTSAQFLAANTSRKGFSIFNDSTAILYVKFGATASATSYTVKMAAGSFYEAPALPTYRGRIDGIWAAANGSALVTELT